MTQPDFHIQKPPELSFPSCFRSRINKYLGNILPSRINKYLGNILPSSITQCSALLWKEPLIQNFHSNPLPCDHFLQSPLG